MVLTSDVKRQEKMAPTKPPKSTKTGKKQKQKKKTPYPSTPKRALTECETSHFKLRQYVSLPPNQLVILSWYFH